MKSGRLGIVAVLIIALVASGLMRAETSAWQARQPRHGAGGALGSTVGSMNSFALALLLGGLRGPLVMFLWASSETQKADRNLEDFDTKVEWIRRLQPEFATVHIFQIWNKAFNVSVLLANPADRYVAITQALEYAASVEDEMPGDVNILSAVAQVYSNKLDGPAVQEKPFYTRQFREETMTDRARKIAYPDDTSFHRLWAGSLLLDDNNRILAKLVTPDPHQAARPATDQDWNDGSALQYLKKYEPFPYGISAQAMSFNYSKRAEVALRSEGQKPVNLSAMVIDSRPGVDLKLWGEEELARARSFEIRAFRTGAADESADEKLAMGNFSPALQPSDEHAFEVAVYSYQMAIRLAADARVEYERHLASPLYVNRFQLYESHLDDVDLMSTIAHADLDYLEARSQSRTDTHDLLRSSGEAYRRAIVQAERIVLKYYVEDAVIRATFPPHTNKNSVGNLTDAQIAEIYPRAMAAVAKLNSINNADNRTPYETIIGRATIRLRLLSGSPLRTHP